MGRFLRLQPDRPDRAIHGYIYYRWTSTYVRVVRFGLEHRALGPLRTFAGMRLARTHHAKVVPAADAQRIIRLDHKIERKDLESVVPFGIARDIVLDSPTRIAVARCACRVAAEHAGTRDGSCGPLESCIYVGDPIASFVVEKQDGARFVTQDEAAELISQAADRGNLQTLWFKDAAAGRMYAICNCCSCCCIGLKSSREGFASLAGSGYLAETDSASCTACGACAAACPFAAIAVEGDSAVVDPHACLGCGVCVQACPNGALSLAASPEGPSALPQL